MDPEKDKNSRRIKWFSQRVNLETTPVFPAFDFHEIIPAVETLQDQMFLIDPPEGTVDQVNRLCPHIFFSLPAMGLGLTASKKRQYKEMNDDEAISALYSSKKQSTNKDTQLRKLMHRVVKDPDSEEMNYDTTYQKLNELVKTVSFSKSQMRGASFLVAPFRMGGNLYEDEIAVQGAFKKVLEPICLLFSGLWNANVALQPRQFNYPNQLDESDEKIYGAKPDITITKDEQPFVCIEVKCPSIDFSDANAFSHALTQAVSQCIAAGTPYGIITDYLNTLCFKISLREEDIESTKNNTYDKDLKAKTTMHEQVKVMYYTVNHLDSVNTLACVLAAHTFDAREDMRQNRDTHRQLLFKLGAALQLTAEEAEIRKGQSYRKFLAYLDRERHENKVCFNLGGDKIIPLSIYEIRLTEGSRMSLLQEGSDYNAQVIKISGEVFSEITRVSPENDHYILKIFDPVKGKRKQGRNFTFTEDSYMRFLKETFKREYTVYDELKTLWGECIPRFYHAGVCAVSEGTRIRFGGLFMIFQFIEGSAPDFRDSKVVESARSGLKKIHKLGVVHGDVAARNMIQTADKRVFLLDFGLATSNYYEANTKGKSHAHTNWLEKELTLRINEDESDFEEAIRS